MDDKPNLSTCVFWGGRENNTFWSVSIKVVTFHPDVWPGNVWSVQQTCTVNIWLYCDNSNLEQLLWELQYYIASKKWNLMVLEVTNVTSVTSTCRISLYVHICLVFFLSEFQPFSTVHTVCMWSDTATDLMHCMHSFTTKQSIDCQPCHLQHS